MREKEFQEFDKEQRDVLKSIKLTRAIWPTLLGIGVVLYLLWQQFDPQEFSKINWTAHTLVWILIGGLILVIRHLSYSLRLYILSQKVFSWKKCIQLIFIWEFASAVSPTSLGGSAVAFFVLAQEKLSTAKTATIVLYTIVMDTLFFVGTLPLLFLLFGTNMIRPDMTGLGDFDAWGYTFLGAYVFMAIYGGLFFYGLFISPIQIKRILIGFTMLPLLRRFRHQAVDLGNDIIVASKEMSKQDWPFHIGAFVTTAIAWSCRFLVINALIIAIVPGMTFVLEEQFNLYARLQTMFVIMAFSPTPGGAGFAEFVFGGFLSDYVPKGISIVVASIWRLMAYYTYLIAGVIILPMWLRRIILERRQKKEEDTPESTS